MLNLKKLLTKVLTRLSFSPIVAIAQRNSTETSVSLTTSNQIIGCSNAFPYDSSRFAIASDGGIRVLKEGTIIAFAFAHTAGVTTGDVICLAIGSYRGGWKHESYSAFSPAGASTATAEVFTVFTASANDTVYVRARNATAARGSVDHAKLVLFALG